MNEVEKIEITLFLCNNVIDHDNKKILTSNTCPLVFRRGYMRGFYIGEPRQWD